ncbi:MAG: hypothetical protein M1816_006992 [Peltula sp. TS41687]|nr:MAG: hypothetical protein M1816_006992 [Peltula sp. TS41687]
MQEELYKEYDWAILEGICFTHPKVKFEGVRLPVQIERENSEPGSLESLRALRRFPAEKLLEFLVDPSRELLEKWRAYKKKPRDQPEDEGEPDDPWFSALDIDAAAKRIGHVFNSVKNVGGGTPSRIPRRGSSLLLRLDLLTVES